MISIKKALFVFAAAVGVAASFASNATEHARRPPDTCNYLLNSCYQGNNNDCELWYAQCANVDPE
ncbi:hypothetical protein OX459_20365 [Janthinobacterium sp. SUN026]|uniref:hypothetical protein n=1 Tax=Janthinobacterium sp. SUN026 TaxID=3002438 RepID=UPI0025B19C24|nr:hypothetical protein [Janthinobacterium sp. SUN026]MDN2673761.1 hypothetical protein [Janthinobacterium sp. SUN026]